MPSGTKKDRGIATWQNVDDAKQGKKYYVEGYNVYDLPLPARLRRPINLKYLPFMPNPEDKDMPMPKTFTYDVKCKAGLGKDLAWFIWRIAYKSG